jgi:hypothetical protein
MKVDLSEFKTDELWLVTGALMRILPIDEDEKTKTLAWAIMREMRKEIDKRLAAEY